MKTVTKIEFIFENTDSFIIDINDIHTFYIGGIYEEVCRIAMNCVCKRTLASEVVLEIHKEANDKYYEFQHYAEDFLVEKFERIQRGRDIASIVVYYNDDTSEEYLNVWEGSDYQNDLQKAEIDGYGDLIVVISKDRGKKPSDYFPTDDEEHSGRWFNREFELSHNRQNTNEDS